MKMKEDLKQITELMEGSISKVVATVEAVSPEILATSPPPKHLLGSAPDIVYNVRFQFIF
jgi:hypothetical protein